MNTNSCSFVVSQNLLFGERYFHGGGRGDLESLQSVSGRSRLNLVLELDEGDVVTTRNQSDLFEARELKSKLKTS